MTANSDSMPEPVADALPRRRRAPSGADAIRFPWRPRLRRPGLIAWVLLVLLAGGGYWWFAQRIEVEPGEILVLIRKVGQPLPGGADQTALPAELAQQVILYPELLTRMGEKPGSQRYRGIVLETKPEGRYFYDPYFWQRIVVKAPLIASDEVGVLVRKFGRSLPAGRIVAEASDERGPLAEVLKPGRYNVNPYAYEVLRVKPVRIPAGCVGVQTLYNGQEPQNPNEYVVASGERGVQPDVLPPGLYYNNPFMRRIDIVDTRSQTIDLNRTDAVKFPSNDSFTITVDCTVEYAIRQDMAPYAMVALGEQDDIRDKLILPETRSLCRIEGSKLTARDFISGDTRTTFQQRLFEGLREQCFSQGIEVRSALIRRIEPPEEIAGPISDRQVALQQIRQYENENKVAQAEARLVEQQQMQKQNQALGEANREVVTVTIEAQQQRAVALTYAQQRLEVAKLNLEAAQQTAQAMLSRGQAEAQVLRLGFEAKATPLRSAVAAFGDGETYAQYHFYQKLAPALKSILASTDGPLADVLRAFEPGKPADEKGRSLPATERPAARATAAGGDQ